MKALPLRDLLLQREALHTQLVAIKSQIATALADPDTDMTGVRVTERHLAASPIMPHWPVKPLVAREVKWQDN